MSQIHFIQTAAEAQRFADVALAAFCACSTLCENAGKVMPNRGAGDSLMGIVGNMLAHQAVDGGEAKSQEEKDLIAENIERLSPEFLAALDSICNAAEV